MKKPIKQFALMGALVFSTAVYAQDDQPADTPPPSEEVAEEAPVEEEMVFEDDFFDMSLEDMLGMEITSVSKKAERLQDVSSAIYVLTSEDIANSGATTLHEALRNVPGYWGVQDEYNSVSPLIRNSPTDNGARGTVLYLLDGTPIQDNMSSVFIFKNFDIPLDEIDRIEVIRGSGGTVYGANSATGVVNIFTKNPEKYDGINAKAEYAAPGYTNITVRAGGKVNDKLSVSGYGKVRSFKGYGKNDFIGDSLYVQKSDGSGITRIKNAFTEDFESSTTFSTGLKAKYALSDKTKLSFNNHYNLSKQIEYTNFDTDMALLGTFTGQTIPDSVVKNDVSRSRVVSHLKLDHEFNEDHSLFVRASTNMENDFIKILGGYSVNNSIYDFEIQDNISLGELNDVSVGANFRSVNFDVSGVNDVQGLSYIDPKGSETLKGFFIQDKLSVLDGKVNLIAGIKAENYSLINDKFYMSPTVKLSILPNENITLWGGFTQSYTTPGYNNTNIDLYLLKALPEEVVYDFAVSQVYQPVFDGVYAQTYAQTYAQIFAQAQGGGADSTQAANAATAQAPAATDGFLASAQGQAIIDGAVAGAAQPVADGITAQAPNQGVINGSETVPTKYQTWEAGFRVSAENKVSIESNFYYSTITDAIAASDFAILTNYESPSRDGVFGSYFLYGNYIKGTTYGTESIIKIIPAKGTVIEFSHVYTEASWEYQENDDFDINDETVVDPSSIDRTPEDPKIPKHVLRMRGSFELPKGFRFNASILYATKFGTETNYDFEQQRHPGILSGSTGQLVAENNTRTIFNFKVEKNLLDDNLNIYIFGNDILNEGFVAGTTALSNVNLSKIGGMFGLGANYKF